MGNVLMFDYYYGKEAEQFSFFRIPKMLVKDERFKGLSSDAKLLYGLMLDRMALSIKKGWLDDKNRAYIHYTIESIMSDLGCSRGTCVKIMGELDDKSGIGLIEKKRQGLGKPDIIYVKNFLVAEEVNHAQTLRSTRNEIQEVQNLEFKKSKNKTSRSTKIEIMEVQELEANKKKYINTDFTKNESINLSNHTLENELNEYDELDRVTMVKKKIKENIEYEYFIRNCGVGERELFEELYDIICEVVLSKRKTMRIGGEDYPTELVRHKFLQLEQAHIEYVMECLANTTTKIKNIRAYIITALYNATSSINFYYQQDVQHDKVIPTYGR